MVLFVILCVIFGTACRTIWYCHVLFVVTLCGTIRCCMEHYVVMLVPVCNIMWYCLTLFVTFCSIV